LKDKQLDFDISPPSPGGSTGHGTSGAATADGCPAPIKGTYAQKRVLINGTLKDTLLDRNLADAVIYAGSYGVSIEHGVADALCRVLKDEPWPGSTRPPTVITEKCRWDSIPPDNGNPTRYIFVTHSLGSRIVFDVVLGLGGTKLRNDPVFTDEEIKQAKPALGRLFAHTSAIYMMANQLPLLGLANARITMTTLDPSAPLNFTYPGSFVLKAQPTIREWVIPAQAQNAPSVNAPPLPAKVPSPNAHQSEPATVAEGDQSGSRHSMQDSGFAPQVKGAQPNAGTAAIAKVLVPPMADPKRRDSLYDFALMRSAYSFDGSRAGALDIVAFSDPNDLLSYSLPKWYDNLPMEANVRVTNVTVNNAMRWFGIIEDPTKAHTGYMNNPDVWKAISSGALSASPALRDASGKK
jgi:hypothetical protein